MKYTSRARIIAAFTKPYTQADLAKAARTSQASVSRYLAELRALEPVEAYISGWKAAKSSGGPPIATYSPGFGEDVECTIRQLGNAERCRRFRTKQRGEVVQRTVRARTTDKAFRDPFTALFFGAP